MTWEIIKITPPDNRFINEFFIIKRDDEMVGPPIQDLEQAHYIFEWLLAADREFDLREREKDGNRG